MGISKNIIRTPSGNVGIGTTSPANKLTVVGKIESRGTADDLNYAAFLSGIYDSSHALQLGVKINSGTESEILGVYADSGGGNPRTVLNPSNSWRVGIGTTNPAVGLDVNGKIRLRDGGNTTIPSLQLNIAGTMGLSNPTSEDIAFITNSTEKMRILSGGNVGIGTTSPNSLLQVGAESYSGGHSLSWGMSSRKEREISVMRMSAGLIYHAYNHGASTHPSSETDFTGWMRTNVTSYKQSGATANIDGFSLTADNYFVEFIGYLYVDTARLYYFNVNSDDASDVFVDGKRVADYYGGHGTGNAGNRGTMWLEVGYHRFYARFEEVGGGDSILVEWSTNGGSTYAAIPAANFFHDPLDHMQSQSGTNGHIGIMGVGNVGIGTPSPSMRLHVVENKAGNTGITIQNTNASYSSQLRFLNSGGTEKAAITYIQADERFAINNAAGGDIINLLGANVGIGTSSTINYKLKVQGDIYASSDIIAYSDARAKENVVTVDHALEKVKNLRGVYYTRKDDETKKKNVGVIAQEVLDVVPELVAYSEESDQYAVKYQNITALLIEAIKEQQQTIQSLQQRISTLETK